MLFGVHSSVLCQSGIWIWIMEGAACGVEAVWLPNYILYSNDHPYSRRPISLFPREDLMRRVRDLMEISCFSCVGGEMVAEIHATSWLHRDKESVRFICVKGFTRPQVQTHEKALCSGLLLFFLTDRQSSTELLRVQHSVLPEITWRTSGSQWRDLQFVLITAIMIKICLNQTHTCWCRIILVDLMGQLQLCVGQKFKSNQNIKTRLNTKSSAVKPQKRWVCRML